MQVKIRDGRGGDHGIPVTNLYSKEMWHGWMGYEDSYHPFPQPEKIVDTMSDDFGNTVICYEDEDGNNRMFIAQSIDLEWTY